MVLPRFWTPEFALISVDAVKKISSSAPLTSVLQEEEIIRIRELSGSSSHIIVRSSVVGESIWEKGRFRSEEVDCSTEQFASDLNEAARRVVASAGGRGVGFLIQRFVRGTKRGEFGNLYRISKSRDHWEINTISDSGSETLKRLNCQRDQAADPNEALIMQPGVALERLFGSIGAWLNSELLLGQRQRLSCEWIADWRRYYIIQIDEEDEDVEGRNPFHVRIPYTGNPVDTSGVYLKNADKRSIAEWDKLKVLNELWESEAAHRPTLFAVRLSDLPIRDDEEGRTALEQDFRTLIGKSGTVVRTSVRAGSDKVPNLPREEGLCPVTATEWCLSKAEAFGEEREKLDNLAFVTHRFVASRASAWVRADPSHPMVEIHALWGLPDALQFCPYDIWEIHVPTGVATGYADYKSDMLIPQKTDERWNYVRVKNELARHNCISATVARELGKRTAQIAKRLGQACHVMWFVGCTDEDGKSFNLPWYWTDAHEVVHNRDRSGYRTYVVSDKESLQRFVCLKRSRHKEALALRPKNAALMRCNEFIASVGRAARESNVPVVLSGSTLAHAYYILRREGCTVITPSEKAHSRIRNRVRLGKLVRDNVPEMIERRHEMNLTKRTSKEVKKGFLIGKLVEEAMEVRSAYADGRRTEELGDLLEVLRAISEAEGIGMERVEGAANEKRRKVGGFDKGLVLLETGISPADRVQSLDTDLGLGVLLPAQVSEDIVDIPFTFFGFGEFDQPQAVMMEDFGVWFQITLRSDRIEIRAVRAPEQLELTFDEWT